MIKYSSHLSKGTGRLKQKMYTNFNTIHVKSQSISYPFYLVQPILFPAYIFVSFEAWTSIGYGVRTPFLQLRPEAITKN